VEIHSPLSLEQQLLYLWTNPVKDGLVERPEAWPGLMFLPEDFGRTIVARKPEGAFFGGRRPRAVETGEASETGELSETVPGAERPVAGAERWLSEVAAEEAEAREQLLRSRGHRSRPRRDRSKLPDRIELTIHPPPGYEHMSLEEVRRHFRTLLDAELERIRAEREASGRSRIMGAEAVLAQSPFDGAGDTWPDFAVTPRIACRGDTRRRVGLLVGFSDWRTEHRRAYQTLVTRGPRQVVFPAGSHAWGALPHVRVRGAPPPTRAGRRRRQAAA
jgi:hypothetical protein